VPLYSPSLTSHLKGVSDTQGDKVNICLVFAVGGTDRLASDQGPQRVAHTVVLVTVFVMF
jgi:hypothetical protein